jgi:hypothetical protein
MSTATAHLTVTQVRCHWRPAIMVAAGLALFVLFWFASRYPQLLRKAEHVGQVLPSMSIIPSIYLWREVSKPLAALLFVFFLLLGWILGLGF